MNQDPNLNQPTDSPQPLNQTKEEKTVILQPEPQKAAQPQVQPPAQPQVQQPAQPQYQRPQYQQPQYQQPQYQQPVQPQVQQPYAPMPPVPGKGNAIAALVLGIVSIVLGWVPVLSYFMVAASIVGIVLAVKAMKLCPTGAPGRGLAVAGLVCCIVGLAFAGLMSVCTGIAACAACRVTESYSYFTSAL